MDRYVGLDAHAESCTLAVVGPSGKRLKLMVVETNGRALVEAIKAIPGQAHVCLEEGAQSAWLYELLLPHVKELVVTMPRESRGTKDDARDAWARAEELRTGALHTRVFKAPQHFTALRNAVRAHVMAVRDVVRAKNRLRSVWRSRGIQVESGIYNSDRRTKFLKQLTGSHRQLAEWLGRSLEELEPLREEAEAWVLKEAKTHPIARKLATAPGMGPIRSAQLVAIVVDPHRFRTSRQFWSYCGLGIVTRSSSDWRRDRNNAWVRAAIRQTRGLTRKRNPLLKTVFKGAATTIIRQLPEDPWHQGYQRMLAAGTKPNLAKLTLARRIAATVLSMWKRQEVYDPKRPKSALQRTQPEVRPPR
jgi:transposase